MIEVLLALALLSGATGVGHRMLHVVGAPRSDRGETAVFSLALGLGSLMMLTLGLGLAGGLYRPALCILTGVWCVAGWWMLWPRGIAYAGILRAIHINVHSPYVWLAGGAALPLLLILIRALAPPHGATDPLAYQLALPRLYLLHHSLSFEPTITGALYTANMGLLYVVSLALRNGILAQLMHLSLAVAVCAGVFAFARRYLSWQAGVFAAAIFSSMPVIVVFAPQGYIDIGLCFFQFTALWAVANWAREPGRRALLLAAILTGLAAGVKHQGMATIFVGVLLLAIRRLGVDRDIRVATRDIATFVVVAFLLILPWYARAYFYSGNPVWPLANDIFHGLPFGYQPVVASGGSGGSG
ncbi:MAG: glycosyltransferase family 39 protein, partial [bacterium]|nr:glycosyltransferase family 39 protein [bacterium]